MATSVAAFRPCAPIMRQYIQLMGSTDALPSGAAEMAPTLVAARTTLPPEGASFPWGGPAEKSAPTPPEAPLPGKYGTRSATTQTGPTPGPVCVVADLVPYLPGSGASGGVGADFSA